jgi:hypothetical protein
MYTESTALHPVLYSAFVSPVPKNILVRVENKTYNIGSHDRVMVHVNDEVIL